MMLHSLNIFLVLSLSALNSYQFFCFYLCYVGLLWVKFSQKTVIIFVTASLSRTVWFCKIEIYFQFFHICEINFYSEINFYRRSSNVSFIFIVSQIVKKENDFIIDIIFSYCFIFNVNVLFISIFLKLR